MIPISLEMHWLSSVVFVSGFSLWALVTGHWSSWQAAGIEVAQSREVEKQRQHPIEDRVVDKLIESTDVSAA